MLPPESKVSLRSEANKSKLQGDKAVSGLHHLSQDYKAMKPRRLHPPVTRLPTITEAHEDASQPGGSTQSLEDYVDSIKELAQPTCGPVRVARTSRPRLFSKPLDKHSGTSSSSHSSSRTQRSRTTALRMDELSHSISSHRDPLDWLFGQTQFPLLQDELRKTASVPAARRLF